MKKHKHKYIAIDLSGYECDICGLLKSTIEAIEPPSDSSEKKENCDCGIGEASSDIGHFLNCKSLKKESDNTVSKLPDFSKAGIYYKDGCFIQGDKSKGHTHTIGCEFNGYPPTPVPDSVSEEKEPIQMPAIRTDGESAVICLKCGARGLKKYIFKNSNIVKCPCGNELKNESGLPVSYKPNSLLPTSSERIENVLSEFEDFYWEREQWRGRKLGVKSYTDWLRTSLQTIEREAKREVIEEAIARLVEKTFPERQSDELDEGYAKAIQEAKANLEKLK